MSYTLDLPCGCVAYVACDPASGVAHTRVIEARGLGCEVRRHEVGLKLYLWDLLPDRRQLRDDRWEERADEKRSESLSDRLGVELFVNACRS